MCGRQKLVVEKQRRAYGEEKVEQQNLSVRREKEKHVPVKLCIECFLIIGSELGSMLLAFLKHRALVHMNVYESKLKCGKLAWLHLCEPVYKMSLFSPP